MLFSALAEARHQIRHGTADDNQHRPHPALGNIPPAESAMKMGPEKSAAQGQKSAQGLAAKPEEKRGPGQLLHLAKRKSEVHLC